MLTFDIAHASTELLETEIQNRYFSRHGYAREERLVLSNPHSLYEFAGDN